jgi:RNA polymerase sigma-70 factor (ECF subfamily)
MKWSFHQRPSGASTDFDGLLRPHLPRLFRLAYRFTQSESDAEDLVQELLVKMLPRVAQLTRLDLPGPWLARALYHLYIDQIRDTRRRDKGLGQRLEGEQVLEDLEDETGADPETVAERAQQHRRLAHALRLLSPDHRAVIAWHDIEGYTLDELSTELEIPIGTLKSRLHRARAHLRELLQSPSTAADPGHPPPRSPSLRRQPLEHP